MNKTKRFFTFFSVAILISTFALTSTATTQEKTEANWQGGNRQFTSQASLSGGTPVSIIVVGSAAEEGSANAAMSAAISRVAQLDSTLFSPGGLQDQINSLGKKQTLELPPDVFALIKKGKELSGQTKGFFDIAAPSPKNTFTNRDWKRIKLNEKARSISFKSDSMKLDLSKIAKGFYADLIIEGISKSGFANAMVEIDQIHRNIGHDIFTPWNVSVGFGGAHGSKYAHRAYRYNIKNSAAATVTSHGLGRNLTDGRSKLPVEGENMRSITVFSNDAATATAFALAVYALGPKYGLKYVHNRPEIKWVLVDNSGQLFASKDLSVGNANMTYKWPAQGSADGGPNDLRQREREEALEL